MVPIEGVRNMLMDKYNPGSSWDSKSRPSEY